MLRLLLFLFIVINSGQPARPALSEPSDEEAMDPTGNTPPKADPTWSVTTASFCVDTDTSGDEKEPPEPFEYGKNPHITHTCKPSLFHQTNHF